MGTQVETRYSGGQGGGEGRVNQTTRMSEQKTRRDQVAADVNQLMSVSSEGLGLTTLFLVNTNNINNHSVIFEQPQN